MNALPEIKGLTAGELAGKIKEMGLPAFRAGQIYTWLHQKLATSFDEMTNLPAALRQQLAQSFSLTPVNILRELTSAQDGTVKYLLALPDGNTVEMVRMHYRHGTSLCISTQVGCRMGCRFCASTQGGLVRNLTPAEMLEEVYTATRALGRRIESLVLMGVGEPLDNLPNVLRFLELLSAPEGQNISLRHVSLSTCGLVEQIDELAKLRLGLTLSVSLHASDNTTRSRLMPVNQRHDIESLLAACRRYFQATGRRVSYEYALVAGENDSLAQADALAKLLSGSGAHVNLIPINPVPGRGFARGRPESVEAFRRRLCEKGVNATVRRELGSDISAACGQLRSQRTQTDDADILTKV